MHEPLVRPAMRAARTGPAGAGAMLRLAWERTVVYLPIILMAFMALGTYWLARNAPTLEMGDTPPPVTHDPDYFMRGFSVRTYEAGGRLKSEIFGAEARHFPDSDTVEIEQPRIRSFDQNGVLTVATARRALSNGDATEVQLFGDAVVTRDGATDSQGRVVPPMQFRGEFLHVFVDTERVRSNKPVELTRGSDRFTADSLDYDHLDRVLALQGRVRGVLVPQPGR